MTFDPSASWPPPAGPAAAGGHPGWSPPPATCYAHPGRPAGSVCRRCGRPICPDCMREAPVGWQCAGCVKSAAKTSPTTRWRPATGPSMGARRLTPVVMALVAVNVVIYLYEMGHPAFEVKYSLSPFLVHYGHRWYELITSAFLHASFGHIFLNMLSLIIIGPVVEMALGRLQFAAVYLISALGGSVVYYLVAPADTLGLGASGAIFGLMGAWFVLARLHGWPLQPVTGLLVVNLVYGFVVSGIAWQAHLGGLLFGAAATAGMALGPGRGSPRAAAGRAVAVTAVLVAVVAALASLPPGHVNLGA